MSDRPPRVAWLLAGTFVVFVAALGYWPEAAAGAVGLAAVWWRLRENDR